MPDNSYADIMVERDRFRQHSMLLNQIGYTVAVALGKVTPPADYHGDVVADFDELITLHRDVTLRNLTLEQAARTMDSVPYVKAPWFVELISLIRDLMMDPDDCRNAVSGSCSWTCPWCSSPSGFNHAEHCTWLRAKMVVEAT